jgi:hypothetical protein
MSKAARSFRHCLRGKTHTEETEREVVTLVTTPVAITDAEAAEGCVAKFAIEDSPVLTSGTQASVSVRFTIR